MSKLATTELIQGHSVQLSNASVNYTFDNANLTQCRSKICEENKQKHVIKKGTGSFEEKTKQHRPHKQSRFKTLEILSHGLSFEENVINERSPHTTPYKCIDIKEYLSTDMDKPKTGRKGTHSSYYNNKHMPCHLTPVVVEPIKNLEHVMRSNSHDSFCLGVSNSEEKLMTKITHSDCENSTRSTEAKNKPNELLKKRPVKGWEEHVLSLVSKSTAEVIVKDYTVQNQNNLKAFLDKEEAKSRVTNSGVDLAASSKEYLNFSDTLKGSQSEVRLLKTATAENNLQIHALGNKKQSEKEFKLQLRKAYPMPPEKWSHKVDTQCKNLSTKGMQKWADYPKELKVL